MVCRHVEKKRVDCVCHLSQFESRHAYATSLCWWCVVLSGIVVVVQQEQQEQEHEE